MDGWKGKAGLGIGGLLAGGLLYLHFVQDYWGVRPAIPKKDRNWRKSKVYERTFTLTGGTIGKVRVRHIARGWEGYFEMSTNGNKGMDGRVMAGTKAAAMSGIEARLEKDIAKNHMGELSWTSRWDVPGAGEIRGARGIDVTDSYADGNYAGGGLMGMR